jgi:hypothetical protein
MGSKAATGTELLVSVPSPSWPTLLLPQHQTAPAGDVTAHANAPGGVPRNVEPPTDTEVTGTPLGRPVTCTGTELPVVELFPSSPNELSPQHQTAPSDVVAQAETSPAETDVTLAPVGKPVTCTGTALLAPFAGPCGPSSP